MFHGSPFTFAGDRTNARGIAIRPSCVPLFSPRYINAILVQSPREISSLPRERLNRQIRSAAADVAAVTFCARARTRGPLKHRTVSSAIMGGGCSQRAKSSFFGNRVSRAPRRQSLLFRRQPVHYHTACPYYTARPGAGTGDGYIEVYRAPCARGRRLGRRRQ